MIAAVIDIGSNTMRMSVYKIEGQKFTSSAIQKRKRQAWSIISQRGKCPRRALVFLLMCFNNFAVP